MPTIPLDVNDSRIVSHLLYLLPRESIDHSLRMSYLSISASASVKISHGYAFAMMLDLPIRFELWKQGQEFKNVGGQFDFCFRALLVLYHSYRTVFCSWEAVALVNSTSHGALKPSIIDCFFVYHDSYYEIIGETEGRSKGDWCSLKAIQRWLFGVQNHIETSRTVSITWGSGCGLHCSVDPPEYVAKPCYKVYRCI